MVGLSVYYQELSVDDDWATINYRGETAYVRTDHVSEELTTSEHAVDGASGCGGLRAVCLAQLGGRHRDGSR